jgi:hypothetical protein
VKREFARKEKDLLDFFQFGVLTLAFLAAGLAVWLTHQQLGVARDTARKQLRATSGC